MAALMPKQLTNHDVTSRLAVPKIWWKHLIGPLFRPHSRRHGAQLWMVDGGGMFWEFQCIVRQKGPHMKPVLQSGGWLKFVHYKGLRVGDRVVLETAVHEFRGTRFVLRAQRFDGQCWFDLM